MTWTACDAVVVGAGPNGLAAAITLAQAGRSVLVLEARPTLGGGCRTAELTLPGFAHDVCSAIHPLAVASPYLRTLPLREHGLALIEPPAALAHPLDDGTAVLVRRSVDETASELGGDAAAYRRLFEPLVGGAEGLFDEILAPPHLPRHLLTLARFGVDAIRSARGLATARFGGVRARALMAGLAAHSMLRLDRPPSAAFALVLTTAAHAVGWPMARGGSQSIVDAMASYLRSLGGEIITDRLVSSVDDLPPAGAVLLDVTPGQLLRLTDGQLPLPYRWQLGRYRHGCGVFKLDWALDGPIPWRASECREAGTVHIGATMEELVAAETAVAQGREPERPFVLLAQQSLFDPSRAPAGKHTAWAYCHVPSGSTEDMTERIERQIERFAPGFRDLVLARHAASPEQLERYNPNYVGGDINGGVEDLRQLLTRPAVRLDPYSTPDPRLYLCSSSTPPGGGVHGMCGHNAARSALRRALAR